MKNFIWQKHVAKNRLKNTSGNPRQNARQRKGRRFFQKFTGDQHGATAVEFGLLALPFFAIIGAILETSLVLLVSQILEAGVQDASRMIRTGQAQSASFTIDEFRAEICANTLGLFECNGFRINVRTVSNFAAAAYSIPIDPDNGAWVNTEQFSPGGGGSIVLVDVHYKWPTFINGLLGFDLADQPDNTRLLSGVAIFRNEPFG